MRKFLTITIFLIIIVAIGSHSKTIQNWIIKNFVYDVPSVIERQNDYALNRSFDFVQITDNLNPKNKQDVLNIIYTFLDSGSDDFSFFCEYSECKRDIEKLSEENKYSKLNNFVHPFNSFNKINIHTSAANRIRITVEKTYSEEDIKFINTEIDKIVEEHIKENMTIREKITAFHDHIINITRYDTEYLDVAITNPTHPSNTALGPLRYGKSLCGGYTDVMTIYLNRLNVTNYKISSKEHIWNLIYFENEWLHIDLTWNDPVTDDGRDILSHRFLLITTEDLESINTEAHEFNKSVFVEAK